MGKFCCCSEDSSYESEVPSREPGEPLLSYYERRRRAERAKGQRRRYAGRPQQVSIEDTAPGPSVLNTEQRRRRNVFTRLRRRLFNRRQKEAKETGGTLGVVAGTTYLQRVATASLNCFRRCALPCLCGRRSRSTESRETNPGDLPEAEGDMDGVVEAPEISHYECGICWDVRFPSKQDFMLHLEEEHSSITYRCRECNNTFQSDDDPHGCRAPSSSFVRFDLATGEEGDAAVMNLFAYMEWAEPAYCLEIMKETATYKPAPKKEKKWDSWERQKQVRITLTPPDEYHLQQATECEIVEDIPAFDATSSLNTSQPDEEVDVKPSGIEESDSRTRQEQADIVQELPAFDDTMSLDSVNTIMSDDGPDVRPSDKMTRLELDLLILEQEVEAADSRSRQEQAEMLQSTSALDTTISLDSVNKTSEPVQEHEEMVEDMPAFDDTSFLNTGEPCESADVRPELDLLILEPDVEAADSLSRLEYEEMVPAIPAFDNMPSPVSTSEPHEGADIRPSGKMPRLDFDLLNLEDEIEAIDRKLKQEQDELKKETLSRTGIKPFEGMQYKGDGQIPVGVQMPYHMVIVNQEAGAVGGTDVEITKETSELEGPLTKEQNKAASQRKASVKWTRGKRWVKRGAKKAARRSTVTIHGSNAKVGVGKISTITSHPTKRRTSVSAAQKSASDAVKRRKGSVPAGAPAKKKARFEDKTKVQDPEPPKDQDPEPPKDQDPEPPKDQDPEPPEGTDSEPPNGQDPEPPNGKDPEPPNGKDPEPHNGQDPEPPNDSDPEPPNGQDPEPHNGPVPEPPNGQDPPRDPDLEPSNDAEPPRDPDLEPSNGPEPPRDPDLEPCNGPEPPRDKDPEPPNGPDAPRDPDLEPPNGPEPARDPEPPNGQEPPRDSDPEPPRDKDPEPHNGPVPEPPNGQDPEPHNGPVPEPPNGQDPPRDPDLEPSNGPDAPRDKDPEPPNGPDALRDPDPPNGPDAPRDPDPEPPEGPEQNFDPGGARGRDPADKQQVDDWDKLSGKNFDPGGARGRHPAEKGGASASANGVGMVIKKSPRSFTSEANKQHDEHRDELPGKNFDPGGATDRHPGKEWSPVEEGGRSTEV